MVQLILIFVFVVWGPLAHAATYYVATTGSNSNDGLSESTPKLTIAHCVSIMIAGDTCLVRGGTYNEGLIRFNKSGTAGAPIVLAAYPGELPIIQWSDTVNHMILIQHSSGANGLMDWITIRGFEMRGGLNGVKFASLRNATISNNWIHDVASQGMTGSASNATITKNIISHVGSFVSDPTNSTRHGLYIHGRNYIITQNLIYDNIAYGIQQNGSPTSYFDASKHAGVEFSDASGWLVSNNVFAYQHNRSGVTLWGDRADSNRYENNIFFENRSNGSTSENQAISHTSPTGQTGNQFRNNLFYATGSGGLTGIVGGTEGVTYTQSGNTINTANPAFVNGGSNALPGSPDWSLQSTSAAIGHARSNELLRNATLTAGAFDTVATPTASITANVLTLNFPMSASVPIQNLSTTGVTVGCTGSACPGSPTVSTVVRRTGTDSIVDVTISGITGNACEAANQNWTVSYNSATGSWTGNDNIGPYPGLHQKIFSFTNLAATNNCDGSPPPPPPAGPYIEYALDEGTGTTATNSGSFGASGNGTLTGSVTWASGNGLVINGSSNQYVAIPYGSGVNPTTQNLTIAFEVDITPGFESLNKGYFGAPLGTNQRLYISSKGGAWAIGVQASNDAVASELSVSPGKNHLCLVVNAGTDTVTLHKNGVASTTSGGVKSITSYTLSDDFELGNLPGNITSGGSGTFRHFVIYQTVEDCNDIYQSTQTPAPPIAGTFAQAAVQAQAVHLPELGGSPTNLVSLNAAKKVVVNGALAWVFQIHCQNIANCDQTSFRLAYRKNGTGSWQQVPNMPTVDGISMYGSTNNQYLNSGATTTRLTGSCAVTNGVTLLDANQVPPVDLPQDGCVMLRWIVKYTGVDGDYYEHRVETEGGGALSTYTALARTDLISPQAAAGY